MKYTIKLALCICIYIFAASHAAAQQSSSTRVSKLAADKVLEVQAREPFRIFDNLYFVGVTYVSAFLLSTDEGLILIDTLYEEYGNYLADNIRKLGFDPADVKYILISHSHRDHFGGAAAFQAKYGAKVGAAEKDWIVIEKQLGDKAPKRDLVYKEGDSLTLGGTTINFQITPGHTPGVLSMSYPVYDHGKKYMVYSFSGAGLSNVSNINTINTFRKSVARVRAMPNIEVNIINHPFLVENFFERADTYNQQDSAGNHPLVLKAGEYGRWLDEVLMRLDKRIAEHTR